MAETIGGVNIESYKFTRAWGTGPASALGVVVGNPNLSSGDYVVYTFGAIQFYGVVGPISRKLDEKSGEKYHFSVVDNRYRLQHQTVQGMWNIEQPGFGDKDRVEPSALVAHYDHTATNHGADGIDPSAGLDPSGSIDAVTLDDGGSKLSQRKRYGHVLPQHFESQIWTYTDEPLSCSQIISSAMNGAWGNFGFTRQYHADQHTTPILNLDVSGGQQMNAFLSGLNQKLNLQMTIDGARTLRWARRGEGSFALPADVQCYDETGTSLSSEATQVRLVGDRNLVQVLNVPLEFDWASGYEPFLSEVAWLDEVDEVFGPYPVTKAGAAERAARAREVTLAEYVKEKDVADDATYLDVRRWGEVSRMDIPVWVYLNQILYRSYRIKPDFDLYGIPLNSLELKEFLLCACEVTGSGANTKIQYRRDPVEIYPSSKAFIIGKGQPLDVLDKRTYELFGRQRSKDLRAEFSVVNEYEIDPYHYSVHFKTPIFIDGDPDEDESIFLYPNKGEGGYEDVSGDLGGDSDYIDVVIPNPDFKITASEIKASFVFAISKFQRDYGNGAKRKIESASDLCYHLLDMEGDSGYSPAGALGDVAQDLRVPVPPDSGRLKEILYENGSSAEDRADEMVSSLISKNAVEVTGSFTRYGHAGMALTGMINRVEVSVDFKGGIVERVTMEKPAANGAFESEETLEQRYRNRDLYPQQAELKREVRQLRDLAKLAKHQGQDDVRAERHRVFNDVFTQPVGDQMASTTLVSKESADVPKSKEDGYDGGEWKAGHVVWLDEKGIVSVEGKRLGGIVTMGESPDVQRKQLSLVKKGVVPVLVKGPFRGGETVGCDEGENICTVGGRKRVGVIDHSGHYTGDKVMLVQCRMGEEARRCPFEIYGEKVTDGVEIRIASGYLIRPSAETGGSLASIVPEWNDKRLNDADQPKETLGDGEYVVRLYATNSTAKIKIEDKATIPTIEEAERVVPLGEFKLANGDVEAITQIVCDNILYDGNDSPCFYPTIYDANYGKLKDDGTAEDADMKLLISPGFVYEVQPNGSVKEYMVQTPDGNAMEAWPLPESALGSSGSTLYLKVDTDPWRKINITGSFTTEWASTEPSGTSAIPPEEGASSGQDGVYYIPLFSIYGNNDDGWYTRRKQTNSVWWNAMQGMQNLGDGAKVYKQTGADGTHQLRTLKGSASGDVPSGMTEVQVSATQSNDRVDFKAWFDASGLGGGANPPSGVVTKLVEIKKNKAGDTIMELEFKDGYAIKATPDFIRVQTPFEVGDLLELDNILGTLMLANAGFKPQKGTAGFRKCNGCVNAQAAKGWFYGTEWMDANAADPTESTQDSPTQGGTINGS